MSPALLRSITLAAVAFIVGYLLGLNAPGRASGPSPGGQSLGGTSASGRSSPPAATAPDAPRIRFDSELFDFGTAEQGAKVVHLFEITNVGKSTLEIPDVTSSCGCTATMLSARRLEPGQKGQVRAEFDSTNYRDQVQIWIHLFTNDPRRRQATILLQGKVNETLRVVPAEVDLGVLREGQEARRSIRVEAARPGERFRVTGVRSTSDAIKMGAVREDPTHPGAAYSIDFSVQGAAPYGMVWDYVRLETDHPKRRSIDVKISRTVGVAGAQATTPSPSPSP